MLIGDVIPLWTADEARGRVHNVCVCECVPTPPNSYQTFLCRPLTQFQMYDTYFSRCCAKIAIFGGKLTQIYFKVQSGWGAFILGHESARCSVHVNVQLWVKVEAACALPPLPPLPHYRLVAFTWSKSPLCLFRLLSHHFS